jgi:iron complex transport system ATP-binding protein
MSKKMLELKSLAVSYSEKEILRNIDLDVNAGEILALIGPNGAGKTTLIRAVTGVLPRNAGNIKIDGHEIGDLSQIERSRYIAVVPQARDLPGFFTVYQTVMIGRTPYLNWLGQPGERDHQAVREALKLTQVDELAGRLVGDLSGGEQQRVLLARALAQDAKIWLMDEPTTHLDFQHQSRFMNVVKTMVADRQLAVLMVVHDLNTIACYADQVAILEGGRVFTSGKPGEVLTESTLSHVFNVPVHVITHPETGAPVILPDGHHKMNNELAKENARVY